jgi:hypothetical protein
MARMRQDVRAAASAASRLIDAFASSGTTVTRTDARPAHQRPGPVPRRLPAPRRPERPAGERCDGERLLAVFPDRILTGRPRRWDSDVAAPDRHGLAAPLPAVRARDITYRGRRARHSGETAAPAPSTWRGPLNPTSPPTRSWTPRPVPCSADLLHRRRALRLVGTRRHPAPNPLTRRLPGARPARHPRRGANGNPITRLRRGIPGLAGTAAPTPSRPPIAPPAPSPPHRSFLDDLRGHRKTGAARVDYRGCRCERAPPGPRASTGRGSDGRLG